MDYGYELFVILNDLYGNNKISLLDFYKLQNLINIILERKYNMKIKELEKYNILVEMCSLILNNTDDKKLINFYGYYFGNELKWFDENKFKIVSDFKKLYFKGNFDYALKYWNMKYRHIYKDIIDEGADWFNE